MQNMVINMCEKFHNDRLTNDRSLGKKKMNNNKYNDRSAWSWRPVSRSNDSNNSTAFLSL